MKQADIPIYIDPDSFVTLSDAVKYPCSTNLMRYDALLSRYYITVEGFEHYGINLNLYQSDSPNRNEQFTEEVTEDLYGVIMDLAPFNYQYNCYLVAQSRSLRYKNRYSCRREFEKALIYQAQYKLKNIDVRDMNGIDLETGNSIYHKMLRKEHRHVSPKALSILKGLGLLFNGEILGKYMINYEEEM